jgi:hypothetical protein
VRWADSYAAYQARRVIVTPMRLAWPSVVAMVGSVAWIVASALDWKRGGRHDLGGVQARRRMMTLAAMKAAATYRDALKFSRKMTEPIIAAKITEVSPSAATRPIGAKVIAQTTIA